MSIPAVTYSFVNGTTADATQVNQNFTDLINGMSDGTRDFTIGTLNVAGAVAFSGAITLGNGSIDDITFNGSIASSIPVKSNALYDIGSSTFGLAGVYLGNSTFTTRLLTAATASYSLTLPATSGSDGYFLRNTGSGATVFHPLNAIGGAINYALAASVATNAMTIALKGADGNDPSSTNRVSFEFRSSTLTTGTPSIASCTAATSTVISSGSTGGQHSGVDEYIYVYALNNSGTVELAWSSARIWDEGLLQTTIAEGGAGAADDRFTLYSTNARNNVPIRFLGRIKSNQAAAGTWASSPTEVSLFPSSKNNLARSEVWVSGGNGYGATDTRIRRFTTVNKNVGSAITYADSANPGTTFTINEDGVYAIYYQDGTNGGSAFAITKNDTEKTTDTTAMTFSNLQILATGTPGSNGTYASISFTGWLEVGDVIRGHSETANIGTTDFSTAFRITKISN